MKKTDENLLLTQESQDENETLYTVTWKGIVVGKLTVPIEENFVLIFTQNEKYNGYLLNKILADLYKKYHRDILFVNNKGKSKVFTKKITAQKKQEASWNRCTNNTNQYLGAYREYKSQEKQCIELRLKKLVTYDDAFYAIHKYLKKYNEIKLTISQLVDKPVVFKSPMGIDDIKQKLLIVTTWADTKRNAPKFQTQIQDKKHAVKAPEPKPLDIKPSATIETTDDKIELLMDVDPVQKIRVLQYRMSNKQSESDAKKRAQRMANLQYTTVKLFNSDDKFIGYIVPRNVEKIREHIAKEINRQMAEHQL